MDAEPITFIELAGPDARAALAAAAARAAGPGSRCELLASDTQPDLFLLLCRGSDPPAAPVGARTWTFTPVQATP